MALSQCFHMFVVPDFIRGATPFVVHGCPHCTLKCVTLVLDADERKEYTLLACDSVSVAYLRDLFALYVGKDSQQVSTSLIQPIVTLNVDKIINPNEWLGCILWTRYKRSGDKSTLEWCIRQAGGRASFYYSVGEDGSLLVPQEGSMIQIHKQTVEVVTGLSTLLCRKPTLYVLNNEAS